MFPDFENIMKELEEMNNVMEIDHKEFLMNLRECIDGELTRLEGESDGGEEANGDGEEVTEDQVEV
jgi:hypothetical protein